MHFIKVAGVQKERHRVSPHVFFQVDKRAALPKPGPWRESHESGPVTVRGKKGKAHDKQNYMTRMRYVKDPHAETYPNNFL
jgi:hypothetical protein